MSGLLHREPFSPAFFAGEKVPKADEGELRAFVACGHEEQLPNRSHDHCRKVGHRVEAPLIRLRHLLPPQEDAGGEGLSTKRNGTTLKQRVRSNVAQTLLSVPRGRSNP
jgi:hypothetical protein